MPEIKKHPVWVLGRSEPVDYISQPLEPLETMPPLESAIHKAKDEITRLLKQVSKESFLYSPTSLGTLLTIEKAAEDCLNKFFAPYWPRVQVEVEAVMYSDRHLSFPYAFG